MRGLYTTHPSRTWHPDTRKASPGAKDEGFVQHQHAPLQNSSVSKVRGLFQSRLHAGTWCASTPLAPSRCHSACAASPTPHPDPQPNVQHGRRQAGRPRPPYKHHAREALPMHALFFRPHSHIQPCTMWHPTPFSQLRRFQQPSLQRARNSPRLSTRATLVSSPSPP